MKRITGDLIQLANDGKFDVIIHGCNCFNTMGAGIAYQIAKHYPEAEFADYITKSGDKNKLGTFTYAICRSAQIRTEHFLMVINAYTQYSTAKSENDVAVDYDAVRSAFKLIAEAIKRVHKRNADCKELRIGYPMIGAGLANGDWNVISSIIDEEFEGLDHTLVIYGG